MLKQLRAAVLMTIVLTVLTGVVYPFLVTGLAQAFFPQQANGSLARRDGQVVGSELIGQSFAGAGYFHPRPSAAGEGYDATASGGSNLGPTSAKLVARVQGNIAVLRQESPDARIPVDLVTTSGSGLDPDITPAGAEFQAPRVARARGIPETDLRQLITRHTAPRQLGILGERRVNVLELNMALDAAGTRPAR